MTSQQCSSAGALKRRAATEKPKPLKLGKALRALEEESRRLVHRLDRLVQCDCWKALDELAQTYRDHGAVPDWLTELMAELHEVKPQNAGDFVGKARAILQVADARRRLGLKELEARFDDRT